MYHYTYLIKSKTSKMKYIGVRSCECTPDSDDYWSSSRHLPKSVKTTHKRRVLKVHNSRKEAVEHEILLHHRYDVAKNPEFYNRAKQTTTSYDTSGVPNPHSEETCRKLSEVNKGKKRTPEMVEAMRQRMLGTTQSEETCKKRGEAIRKNGSNKGTRNSQFRPWYISTETFTYIFNDVSKNEQSILDGHYKKYYADIQKKFNKAGTLTTRKYGKVVAMGFIPT
ncbi:hypothetical protein [Pseudorhizobium pelagicum]|uniref:hypothetical protein n=1 Tax=Pseudorhizobium pelagicum TaxID=1509405 RepID=UPI0011111BFF|nr:hypothetical protein [Pseudorhizobium pelagicum]